MRPPGDVWPYLVERDKQAQWTDVPIEPSTEGPDQAGSRMRLRFGKGPLRASLTLEVTAADPPERMAFTTVSDGGLQWDGEWSRWRLPGTGPPWPSTAKLLKHRRRVTGWMKGMTRPPRRSGGRLTRGGRQSWPELIHSSGSADGCSSTFRRSPAANSVLRRFTARPARSCG